MVKICMYKYISKCTMRQKNIVFKKLLICTIYLWWWLYYFFPSSTFSPLIKFQKLSKYILQKQPRNEIDQLTSSFCVIYKTKNITEKSVLVVIFTYFFFKIFFLKSHPWSIDLSRIFQNKNLILNPKIFLPNLIVFSSNYINKKNK